MDSYDYLALMSNVIAHTRKLYIVAVGIVFGLLQGCASSSAQLEGAFAYRSPERQSAALESRDGESSKLDLNGGKEVRSRRSRVDSTASHIDVHRSEADRSDGKVADRLGRREKSVKQEAGAKGKYERAKQRYLAPTELYSVEPANRQDFKNLSQDVVADELLSWTDQTPVYLDRGKFYEGISAGSHSLDSTPNVNLSSGGSRSSVQSSKSKSRSDKRAADVMASVPVMGHWELTEILSEEVCGSSSGRSISDCKTP